MCDAEAKVESGPKSLTLMHREPALEWDHPCSLWPCTPGQACANCFPSLYHAFAHLQNYYRFHVNSGILSEVTEWQF